VGQSCTAPTALRGSTVPAPKPGDVGTVPQLCAAGASVADLPHAPSIFPPATTVSDSELDKNQSLPALVALGAPDAAAIDIRTINGNWTHLFSGAYWHAPAITAKGELQAIDTGHARFSVAAALGYFAVVLPRFLARVKGTIFDVDYEPGQFVSFSVSEGSVAIVRITAVHLLDENRTVDGIRETDVINATGKNSIQYKLPLQIERTFKNANEAEKQFEQELRSATSDGDPQLVDDALNNIQLITGNPVAAVGAQLGHGASTGSGAATAGTATGGAVSAATLDAIGIVAALAAAGVVAFGTKSSSSSSPQSGSISLRSAGRASPEPRASPSASPSALPRTSPAAEAPKPKGHQ
jgi:hypothetical protein